MKTKKLKTQTKKQPKTLDEVLDAGVPKAKVSEKQAIAMCLARLNNKDDGTNNPLVDDAVMLIRHLRAAFTSFTFSDAVQISRGVNYPISQLAILFDIFTNVFHSLGKLEKHVSIYDNKDGFIWKNIN